MQLRILLLFSTMMMCFCARNSPAVAYVNDSAHGSTTYGVDRLQATAGFAVANCAHCHEQHASVGGSEPAPVTGPKEYLLFDQSNTDQATNFCFNCHGTGTAYQAGGHVTNRSYSYRAGGWLLDTLSSNIKSAFAQASSHNLGDIVSFAGGNPPNWKYTTKSNACAVCHDPHVVQGDPPNPTNFKAPGTRGVAISEINSLSSPVNLWGDIAAEMMLNYSGGTYQAPYRTGPGVFEPAGDGTSNGSNLPDYVTFCSKCHDSTVAGRTVTSTDLGRIVKNIDWTNGVNFDKHGQALADGDIRMNPPYIQGAPPLLQAGGYVLSCLDCHEPHGSGNLSLLRGKVNGVAFGYNIPTGLQFDLLCKQCHNPRNGVVANDWQDEHHNSSVSPDAPYIAQAPCTTCHLIGTNKINCATCHFHGAVSGVSPGVPPADLTAPANPALF